MNLLCVKCWNADATVKLLMDGSNEFECSECGEQYTCGDVRTALAALKKYEAVLTWLEAAPVEAA